MARRQNNFISLIILALCILTLPALSCSADKKEASSNLSKDEAVTLLKELAPNITVLEVGPSAVEGLWEVAVESNGKKAVVYIDSSKKYMVQGSIINLQARTNLTQERFNELNKIDLSLVPLDDAVIMGAKDASIRVIVFTDPDCPYCVKLHQEAKKVIEKRKDIVFFVKLFPLKMHPDAYDKAKAIVCEKSSLALLNDVFDKKQISKPKCETKVIDENIKLAEKLGITGTPAMILPNGILVPGYKEADALIELIDKSAMKK
ncbi:MAG: DsbC family protein [Thermodesulfovibrionales bacterium]|nr:DsbC family protein [Thermodesulfovibrionales bacterium]